MKTALTLLKINVRKFLVQFGFGVLLGFAGSASGALIAYDGFDYTVGSQAIGQSGAIPDWNGGTGWAGPWEDPSSASSPPVSNVGAISDILAGSLGYTDAAGNALVTTGNKLHNSGTNIVDLLTTQSRPARSLATFIITNGTTTWMSFVGQRTGQPNGAGFYERGANLSLFNTTIWATNTNGRLAIGESSGAPPAGQANDTWGIVPVGLGSARRQSSYPFTNVTFVLIRIDHFDDDDPMTTAPTNNSDNLYFWLNPTNLAIEPPISIAATNILVTETNVSGVPTGLDFAFDRLVLFAGAVGAVTNPAAELLIDEIRIGTTYADVAPYIAAVVPVQPRWTSIAPSGGGMSLTVTGAPNVQLTVQISTNLSGPNWGDLGPVNLNGSGVGTFTDSSLVATNRQRFYRARQ